MKKFFIASLLFFSSVTSLAYADSWIRCDSRIVRVGASRSEVIEQCGEPADRTERREFRTLEISQTTSADPKQPQTVVKQSRTLEIIFEKWRYDFGPNQLPRFLTFEDGRLKNVQVGSRGE